MIWGLKHEDSARNSYLRVQKHLHYKVKLVKRGFFIPKAKPFGASVDNIRSCECACECKDVLVEYKCPWVHRDLDPKEALLTKEIGDVKLGKKDHLKATTKSTSFTGSSLLWRKDPGRSWSRDP